MLEIVFSDMATPITAFIFSKLTDTCLKRVKKKEIHLAGQSREWGRTLILKM
jgi:hypothetical protein